MSLLPDAWEVLGGRLTAPFSPLAVRFRLAGPVRHQNGKLFARAVAFVPAFIIEARLDKVLGPEHWTFRWRALAVAPEGTVLTVKGSLSLADRPPKEALGSHDARLGIGESAVTESLRACAALWGIGRYLQGLDLWVPVSTPDQETWGLSDADIACLQSQIPRSGGGAATSPGSPPPALDGVQDAADVSPSQSFALGVPAPATVVFPSPQDQRAAEASERAGGTIYHAPLLPVRPFLDEETPPAPSPSLNTTSTLHQPFSGDTAPALVRQETPPYEPAHLAGQPGEMAEAAMPARMPPLDDSSTPVQAPAPQPPTPPATPVQEELWERYVDLHTQAFGHPPDSKVQASLRPSVLQMMIKKLRERIDEKRR